MRILITGTTGMVGKAVALHCLEDPRVTEVVSISRSSAGIEHPKFSEFLVPDFSDLALAAEALRDIDGCFFALGVSSVGKNEEQYSRVTYDLTLGLASALHIHSPHSVFAYVSGMGTDSSESGKTMWARVKGRTENALQNIGFKACYAFRPGYIKPHPQAPSKTALYRIPLLFARYMHPLIAVLFPKSVTTTENIAMAFLALVEKTPADMSILEVRDINQLAQASTP